MKLRQVALAASQLEPWRSRLMALLDIDRDFKDPGVGEFGLENSVMAIGDTFLEIVAPTQPDTAAGRTLQRRNTEACGYMALLQVDDFASFRTHLDALRLRRVWEIDRPEVSACHVHPKDIGGAIVSFDQMRPPEDWVWGGPRWQKRKARAARRIVGCVLQSPDPDALLANWARVLDRAPEANRLTLDDGTFIAVTETGAGEPYEGIRALVIEAPDPDALCERAAQLGLGEAGAPRVGEFELQFVN